MQKRSIPKQANFTKLNPKIAPLEPDCMAIPQETIPWMSARRIAVVNNYGAAGSNAAIVVDDPTSIQSKAVVADAVKECSVIPSSPIFISAKSPEALQEYCSAFSLQLSLAWEQQFGAQATQALAYNLSVKQNRQLEYNYTFSASSVDELKAALDRANEQDFPKRPQKNHPIVLCIGGQNGCTAHIDPGIYETCNSFKKHLVCGWCSILVSSSGLCANSFIRMHVKQLVRSWGFRACIRVSSCLNRMKISFLCTAFFSLYNTPAPDHGWMPV